MAKQKNGSKNGSDKQSKKGDSNKGSSCATASAAAREATRKQEARVNETRDALRATGEFYVTKNDGRETDIFMIEAGVPGLYAIPGGEKPSVHLREQMYQPVDQTKNPFAVIYFEGAHEKAGLPGNLATDTFLPVWALEKSTYEAKFDGIAGETQGQLYQFLTEVIDDTRSGIDESEVRAAQKSKDEKILRLASGNLSAMKDGMLGNYSIQDGDGVAVDGLALRSTVGDLITVEEHAERLGCAIAPVI